MYKITLPFVFLLIISISALGQIHFEKGYLVDNENKRTECLIRNLDWKNNPSEFTYKLDESGQTEKGGLMNVKEFGVYNSCEYIRATVNIDRTSPAVENLTVDKNPLWSNETLFLKVLVKGKANLYYFEEGNLVRFFYSVQDTSIRQLIYKEYLVDRDLAYNAKFRQQLWLDVKLPDATMDSYERIDYNRPELEKYFLKYNGTKSAPKIVNSGKSGRESFNFKITAAANLASITVFNTQYTKYQFHFQNHPTFSLGIESEFILPFRKNKWGLLLNPQFQYFKAENDFDIKKIQVDYTTIVCPIGFRYYSYLNDNLKLFADAFYNSSFCFNMNSSVHIDNFPSEIACWGNFAFGAGIEKSRMSLELRYYTNRELLRNETVWGCDYNLFSLQLGYKLIRIRR